jgi:flagellar biosynthesis/type III secretory pathway protein FliH
MTALPTEKEIASVCIDLHLASTEVWKEVELVEDSIAELESSSQRSNSHLANYAPGVQVLCGRGSALRNQFYSAVVDWFVRTGAPICHEQAVELSKFAFEQKLYEFKNRGRVSPFVIDLIKGLRTELEALNNNINRELVSLVQDSSDAAF